MKSEASDAVKSQKNLNDSHEKCATQEDKLKAPKPKLKKRSKSYNKMLEKLDRKQQQLTKCKAEQEEQTIRLKQSAKDIKNVENDKFNKFLTEEKEKIKKSKKTLNYYKDKASRHVKDLIVDKDEEIELLQEQLKELKLEKDGLQDIRY